MKIEMTRQPSRLKVRLDGSLTYSDGAERLRRMRGLFVRNGVAEVELDLEKVEKVDSAGVGECIALHSRLRRHGVQLILSNLPRRMQQMLQRAHLDEVLSVSCA